MHSFVRGGLIGGFISLHQTMSTAERFLPLSGKDIVSQTQSPVKISTRFCPKRRDGREHNYKHCSTRQESSALLMSVKRYTSPTC